MTLKRLATTFILTAAACGGDSERGASAGPGGGSGGEGGTASSGNHAGGTGGDATSGGGGSGAGGSHPSSGCGTTPTAPGEFEVRTIQAGGKSRTYKLLVPSPYDAAKPLALVFVFHGAGGNSDAAIGLSLHTATGARDNAVFVFPDGIPFEGFGVGWDETCSGYDMPLFDELESAITSEFCIDTNRVFASGFSWGGDFSNALGCCRGNAIRAVAPASGGEWGNELGSGDPTCGAKMPAFRLTYADNDAYSQAAFDGVIELYREAQHCEEASSPTDPSPCEAYDGCDQAVIACRYSGIGHTTPANWNEDTWAFLSSFQ